MGIGPSYKHGSSGCYECEVRRNTQPNPRNYSVEKIEELHGYLVAQIKYDNCTNYEGRKILVYKGVKIVQLINHPPLDPHFSNDKSGLSPIARFEPTEHGWLMAKTFVESWSHIEANR